MGGLTMLQNPAEMIAFLWDCMLVACFLLVGVTMPEIFPAWMALCTLPILLCRQNISLLDRQLR